MVDNLTQILIASILIESIWETIRILIMAIQKKNTNEIIAKTGALAISILICVNYKIDLLNFLGFRDHLPYLGMVLTGIVVSRGSNFMHDLLNKLQKPNLDPVETPKIDVPKVVISNDETTVGKE